MGTAPAPVTVLPNGSGNPLDGAIRRSPVDDAFGAMSSKLLILLRAVKINPANAAIINSLGNPVTAKTGATKTNSDANFAGHETITLNNQNSFYTMNAGQIGTGAYPVAMTNSFTVLAGLRQTIAETSSLYGDNAGTTGTAATGAYLDSGGILRCSIGGTTDLVTGSGFLTSSVTSLLWWSYDSATKTHRVGLDTAAILAQATGTQTRNGAGTGTICYPFGYQPAGSSGAWAFHRWALFNKAYLNGAVPADDQQFAGLLATYKYYLAL